MRRISLLLVPLFILSARLPAISQARDVKTHRLTYGTGYRHLRMLDRQVTPLIYQGHVVPIIFGYTQQKKNILSADISIELGLHRTRDFVNRQVILRFPDSEGQLNDEIMDVGRIPIIQHNLNVAYHWKLRESYSQLDYYFGGNLREFFSLSFSPTAIFVINEFSINPSFLVHLHANQSTRFTGNLSVPIMGLLVRLPYANDPADGKHGSFGSVYTMGTQFFSPVEYQRIDLNLGLEKMLTDRWTMAIQYRFHWFNYTEKRGLTAYNNAMMVKFTKQLGK